LDEAMPFFRIAAAVAILWLIKPDVILAPAGYVAAQLRAIGGETPTDPAALIAKACAVSPETCRDMALKALNAKEAIETGSLRPKR
jgi:hypothetical protein